MDPDSVKKRIYQIYVSLVHDLSVHQRLISEAWRVIDREAEFKKGYSYAKAALLRGTSACFIGCATFLFRNDSSYQKELGVVGYDMKPQNVDIAKG